MTLRLSVVIPTSNGAEFIERTLASVCRQTRPPDEILVVDDRSRDNTRDIVQGLVAGAPVPLRVIPLAKNSGRPARPLNVGIGSASGDLIVALEQDDTMRPSPIEGQEGAARAYPGRTLVAGRFSVKGNADGDMRPIWPVPQFSGVIDDIETAGRFVVLDARRAFRELMRRSSPGDQLLRIHEGGVGSGASTSGCASASISISRSRPCCAAGSSS
jgi:glycosyltransferase involved in cell wall biosynthesis